MYGKDGALYLLNYDGYYNSVINPSVVRVTYVGNCKVPLSAARPRANDYGYQKIWLSGRSLVVGEKGGHTFSLYDLGGHRVYSTRGVQGADYVLSDLIARQGLKRGVYVIKVETAQGLFIRPASLL
jgi:hypothetical protein